ncbi:hypothetical protein DLM45_13450 [Hyphomicrobium methylovorum]|uniref:hypothetical protein n=1 Tax=Hyphomicrobium methylovorum TaxID=84 RepID=UPI0015E70764|nr:hypothetical protein [Hyphomicrobium methylovorum]MBA2127220.1 hypothetical protein [Hyphomicrobium methylovorum]
MPSELLLLIAIVGVCVVTVKARRDHARQRALRTGLFDSCVGLLDLGSVSFGEDGYPILEGRRLGKFIRAIFILDTMTIRRLPQLWLSVTRIEPRKGRPAFAALVRPAGTEFYSLSSTFPHRLDNPPNFPDEVLVRGSGEAAQTLLLRMEDAIRKILLDPKIKEIAVTEKGLRVIWQAAEGRRGEHLILRQSIFDNNTVSAEDFNQMLAHLDALSEAAATADQVRT